jgi:hypothetical protein
MPVHTIYYGVTVQDGVLVPSTGEVILSFQSNARTVRGTTTPDGWQMFSVFESINLVCMERGGFAADEWRRLKETGLKKEIRQMKTRLVDADLAEMVDVKVKKYSKYKHIYVSQPGERGMVHVDVARLKVVSQRTLNRRERAGGAEAEAEAAEAAEGPAK